MPTLSDLAHWLTVSGYVFVVSCVLGGFYGLIAFSVNAAQYLWKRRRARIRLRLVLQEKAQQLAEQTRIDRRRELDAVLGHPRLR